MKQIKIDLSTLPPTDAHDLLTSAVVPRPIAWISSVSGDGHVNLAPFSFFSGVTWSPPTLSVSIVNRKDGGRKDTILNIEETGGFVVNTVSEEMGDLMVKTAATLPREVDEAREAGIVLIPSTLVEAPRIRDAKIAFECELDRIISVGTGPHGANLVLGRIDLMHVDEEILASETRIHGARSQLLGRLSGTKYCRIRSVLEIRPEENKT